MARLNTSQKLRREENIKQAIKHYQKSGEQSIRTSAETFDIPYTTLRDRLAGARSRHESHQGQQLLVPGEEKSLVRWILQMDDRGFPPKTRVVKEMATYLVQKRQSGRILGNHWLERFLDQNPQVTSRFANRLDRARNSAANPEIIKDFFGKLQQVIREYNIILENMYNMDEKGFMMGVSDKTHVICRRGRKNPRLTLNGSRTWVTIVEGISATEVALPPMVVSQGTAHYKGWYAEVNEEDHATFSYSPNGWSDCHLGLNWLRDNFDTYTKERFDTYYSHVQSWTNDTYK